MKHVDEKILKCTAFTDNNELIIKISDTGVGIPDEKKNGYSVCITLRQKKTEARESVYMWSRRESNR